MSSTLSVGSGALTNHHWISKYTEAVLLWKAHAISMFCPSFTVMLEGRSVKRPADERTKEWKEEMGWRGMGHNTEGIVCGISPFKYISMYQSVWKVRYFTN